MEKIKNVLVTIVSFIAAILSVLFFVKNKQSQEFEVKNEELKHKEEDAKKEVDKAKEKVDTIKVEDMTEEEVIDYWEKGLNK